MSSSTLLRTALGTIAAGVMLLAPAAAAAASPSYADATRGTAERGKVWLICEGGAGIFDEPSYRSDQIDTCFEGPILTLCKTRWFADGNRWYRVHLEGGDKGWVNGSSLHGKKYRVDFCGY